MAFQAMTRSESIQKIDPRPPLQQNGAHSSIRAQEIHINDLIQPYQEQITEIVDTVEQKAREFTATRNEIELTEDSSISQAMLDSAQEHVTAMQNEVAGLRDKF